MYSNAISIKQSASNAASNSNSSVSHQATKLIYKNPCFEFEMFCLKFLHQLKKMWCIIMQLLLYD